MRRILMALMVVAWTLNTMAAQPTTREALPAVDLSTPQSAMAEFKAAHETQQLSREMETAIYSDAMRKLLESEIESMKLTANLRGLAFDKYGVDAMMMLEESPVIGQALWKEEMSNAKEFAKGYEYAINGDQGDQATCSSNGKVEMRMRKTEKGWKLENPQILPADEVEKATQRSSDHVKRLKKIQEDVKAGKFKNADAFNDEMTKLMLKKVGVEK